MKVKKINNILTIIIAILFIILAVLVYGIIKDLTNEVKETVTIDTIEEYNYSLTDNDTEYFKENFKKLKEILKKEEVDMEEYAKTISKLWAIDFYSLSSAINKNDVGGTQFIKEEYKENYIKKAKDTIYSTVENNIYGDRTQKLPNVTNVEVKNINKKNEKYTVELEITYEEDLNYDKSVEVIIEQNNKSLEITKIN